MSLIDEIPIPPNTTELEMVNIDAADAYKAKYGTMVKSSMETCRKYYTQLQEAIYSISSYIISYEHANESLDFSLKQLNFTLDELIKINDRNLYKIRGHLIKNKDKNRYISWDIEDKIKIMKKMVDILNEKSKRIVEINNYLNRIAGQIGIS